MLHKGCLDPILRPRGGARLVVLMIQALAVARFEARCVGIWKGQRNCWSQGDGGGAGGEAAMREGNMSLWQVQVLSRGRNTPDSRLTHSPSLHRFVRTDRRVSESLKSYVQHVCGFT